MKRIDMLERSSIFVFTRIFALISIMLLCSGIAAIVVAYFGLTKSTLISFEDVKRAIAMDEDASGSASTSIEVLFPKVSVPALVKEHLSGSQNERVLAKWLEDLDDAQQRDFLDNLASLIAHAEAVNQDVTPVVNQYRTLKLAKLNDGSFAKYEESVKKGGLLFLAAILVLLVALFSLVLVLLAIERNTRKPAILLDAAMFEGPANSNDASQNAA